MDAAFYYQENYDDGYENKHVEDVVVSVGELLDTEANLYYRTEDVEYVTEEDEPVYRCISIMLNITVKRDYVSRSSYTSDGETRHEAPWEMHETYVMEAPLIFVSTEPVK